MNSFKTLTGGRKIMNMAKLGTVSRSLKIDASLANPHKQRAGDLMRYILCVFQDKVRRHSSRYGFGFDIPSISGQTTPARCSSSSIGNSGQSGFYVIPGQTPMGRTPSKPLNPLRAVASSPILPLKELFRLARPFQWVCGLFLLASSGFISCAISSAGRLDFYKCFLLSNTLPFSLKLRQFQQLCDTYRKPYVARLLGVFLPLRKLFRFAPTISMGLRPVLLARNCSGFCAPVLTLALARMGCLPIASAFAGSVPTVGLAFPAKPFLTFEKLHGWRRGAQHASTAPPAGWLFACETFAGRGQS